MMIMMIIVIHTAVSSSVKVDVFFELVFFFCFVCGFEVAATPFELVGSTLDEIILDECFDG